MLLVGAAAETTRWALMTIVFHLLDKPEMMKTLKKEILAIWPDMDAPPTYLELEQLLYLTAVIQEGENLRSLLS